MQQQEATGARGAAWSILGVLQPAGCHNAAKAAGQQLNCVAAATQLRPYSSTRSSSCVLLLGVARCTASGSSGLVIYFMRFALASQA